MRISTVLALIRAKDEINRLLWVKSIGADTLKTTLIQIAADSGKLNELTRAIYDLETVVRHIAED